MKKTYNSPKSEEIVAETSEILAGSGPTNGLDSTTKQPGDGGTNDGSHTPGAKTSLGYEIDLQTGYAHYDAWED